MKKLTALFLVFLLALCLAACAAKKPEQPDDTTPAETQPKPVEKETVVLFEKNKRSPFRLVYGSECSYEEYASIVQLKDTAYQEMWATLNLRVDTKEPEEKEILIGSSSRPESAKALEGLAENESIISFDGNKLIINAKDPYGTKCALRWFLDEYVKGKETCTLEVGMQVKQTYEIPEQVTVLRNMKRGMNLESYTISLAQSRTPETFRIIADGGFDHVRITVNVPNFMNENKLLDEEKMKLVDAMMDGALDAGLTAILDLHYWNVLSLSETLNPDDVELFYSMWRQLAQRYADYPAKLCFEFLNEPHGGNELTDEKWNELQMQAYREVRAIDPDRILFFSPMQYNQSQKLEVLELPKDDDCIAIDVHNYFPIHFTHQHVPYLEGMTTTYPYTPEILAEFCTALDVALDYRKQTGVPMIIGEFSVSWYLEEEYVSGFLSDVTTYMEQNDIAWTYWDFDGWAIYDHEAQDWYEFRYGAVMGKYKMFMKEKGE